MVVLGVLDIEVADPPEFSIDISVFGHFSIFRDPGALDIILIVGVHGLLLRKFSDPRALSLSEIFVEVDL